MDQLLFSWLRNMFEQSLLRDLLSSALSSYKDIDVRYILYHHAPLIIQLASLENLFLLLRDDFQRIDDGCAHIERIPGDHDEGGLSELDPVAVNELLEL